MSIPAAPGSEVKNTHPGRRPSSQQAARTARVHRPMKRDVSLITEEEEHYVYFNACVFVCVWGRGGSKRETAACSINQPVSVDSIKRGVDRADWSWQTCMKHTQS